MQKIRKICATEMHLAAKVQASSKAFSIQALARKPIMATAF